MKVRTRFRRYRIPVLMLVVMLLLVACGGDDGGGDDSGDDAGDSSAAGGGTADLSIENLDSELVLDNSGTLAEDEPFENFVINYPSNWHARQDGFEMTVSNNPDVVNNKGFILAGTQEIPEGAVLINALSQASLQYGGYPVGDVDNAQDLMTGYLSAFGVMDEPVEYTEADVTAYRYVSVDGVEQFFPGGTVLVSVEYEDGLALYQVVFDGPIEEFEPSVREIINNASIAG